MRSWGHCSKLFYQKFAKIGGTLHSQALATSNWFGYGSDWVGQECGQIWSLWTELSRTELSQDWIVLDWTVSGLNRLGLSCPGTELSLDWIVLDWVVPGLNRLGLNSLGLTCRDWVGPEAIKTIKNRTKVNTDISTIFLRNSVNICKILNYLQIAGILHIFSLFHCKTLILDI